MNFRRIMFRLIRLTALPFIFRELLQRKKVTILLYHEISSDTAEKSFQILKKYYNIISLRDFISYIADKNSYELPPKALIITFDDGHKSNFELIDIIERLQVPITIFLCSGIVGTNRGYWFHHVDDLRHANILNNMSSDEFENMLLNKGFDLRENVSCREALSGEEIEVLKQSQYIDLQSHTRYHYFLPNCGDKLAREEIYKSKSELEYKYGLHINAIAFPGGVYGEREVQYARESGYSCALTVDSGFNSEKTDPYRLKRISVNDAADINELIVKASGIWSIIKGK